jgi:hypothetical protein
MVATKALLGQIRFLVSAVVLLIVLGLNYS